MQKRSRNLRLSTALIAPMLLITLATVAYAAISNSVAVTFTLKSGGIDPRITKYWVTEYCGYGCTITLTNSNKTLTITDNLLFAGWKLNLTIEIENDSPARLTLNYTITYFDGTNGIEINATRLFELTGIEYEDGFYLEQTCQTPIPDDFILEPNTKVYKREHLSFNAQDPELQGKYIEFNVTINFYTE